MSPDRPIPPIHRGRRAVEILLLVTYFFVLAGAPAPDVNESHYLAKAKHYWNPQWGAGDVFLESADAHEMFYWSVGWLTLWLPLEAVAWTGRFLTWGLLAWSWHRLSHAIVPGPLYALLSAALFATLMHWGHMAGEWVIGGVEAKGFAYVFVFLALEALVRERWRRALAFCGAGAAFHVIVGGWAMVAVAMSWLLTSRQKRPALLRLVPGMVAGAVLSLPGLVPGLLLNVSADPTTVQEANRIYVFGRLSHHLAFHRLPHEYIARHATLMVSFLLLWWWLAKRQRSEVFTGPLPRFVAAGMLLAVMGAVLDQSLLWNPPVAAAILRYYWFRLSDVMTPLGVTFGLLVWQQRLAVHRPAVASGMLIGLLLLVAAEGVRVVVDHWRDRRPGAVAQAFPARQLDPDERRRRWLEWMAMTRWIRDHTPPEAIFLTPRHQQTFKWDTGRPEVVNGKDFPQDAETICDWRRRMDEVFPGKLRHADLVGHGEERLLELSRKFGFRYIVVDRGASRGTLRFPRIYPEIRHPDTVYEIYQVPSGG